MDCKPWLSLNPNDFQSMWWKTPKILDISKCNCKKNPEDILAYYIIQDSNMGGNFWHIVTWYIDDPNRYTNIMVSNQWPFNKELINMVPGDTIYLTENINVQFNVNESSFSTAEQKPFCKILERSFISKL